jgi:small subunit ribosomal protein S21
VAVATNEAAAGVSAGKTDNQKIEARDEMAQVQIHEGESIESALRRFKRKVMSEDIIKEVKKHSFYVKPGEKKRIKQASARKRARKKIRRQPTEDR